MNVGELRNLIAGIPDKAEVILQTDPLHTSLGFDVQLEVTVRNNDIVAIKLCG